MNRYFKLLVGTLILAIFFAPGGLLAACKAATPVNKAGTSSKEKEKKPKVFIKVGAVDVTKSTITIIEVDGTEKTYLVDTFTKITIEGKSAKLAAVTSGMKADYVTNGAKLARIELTAPPEEKADNKK